MSSHNITISAKAPEKIVVVIHFTCDSISPSRDIDMGKLGIDVDSLPAKARKIWKLDVVPKSIFGEFENFRAQAKAACSKVAGYSPMFGWVTTRAASIEAMQELGEIEDRWYSAKAEMLETYLVKCEEHLDRLIRDNCNLMSPVHADEIREAIKSTQPTIEIIEERLNFRKQRSPVALDESDFDDELFEDQRNAIVSMRDTVMGSLIKEVCSTSRSLLLKLCKKEQNYNHGDQHKIHGSTVACVENLRKKLYELSFIHKNVKTVHDEIETILASCQHRNVALFGKEYQNFKMLLTALSDQIEVDLKLRNNQPLIMVSSVSTPADVDFENEDDLFSDKLSGEDIDAVNDEDAEISDIDVEALVSVNQNLSLFMI